MANLAERTSPPRVDDCKPKSKGREQASETHWKRHPDLYFDDGSVVLLAEDTLFRCYLKWLGKHSEVFAQMSSFSSVQPPDSETYDGCPLVRLTDSAQDLAYFLDSMDGCRYHFTTGKPTPFPVVAGVLRLASKYMVAPLRAKAIYHMCRLYPSKFEDMTSDHKNIFKDVFGSFSDGPVHPIVLVNLLRACDVAKLLPWAYYAVVRWSYRDMILGYKQPDGSVVRLAEQDMQACLLGFETLMSAQHSNIKHVLHGPGPDCSGGSKCSESISEAYTRALEEHGTGLIAPLGTLRRKVVACQQCVADIKHKDEEKRKEVWERLPNVFGLTDWSALEE